MDISKLIQRDKEEEVKVKTLLELSEKKYNLQKELESFKVRLSVKQSELKKLQKKVVSLKSEVPVLEKQEEIAKKTARDLIRELVVKNAEIKKNQENVWMKINSFVSDANARLATLAKSTGRCDTKKNPRKEREDKIRQLKVESEIEAMQLYEKYQSTKMEELKLIRDLLEEDSFVI